MSKSDAPKLVSMKLPKKAAEEERYPSMDTREYPWGLQLTLENEQLKALGMSQLPKVGATMTITAKVEICSVSQYESQDQDDRRSIGLQITDLALGDT